MDVVQTQTVDRIKNLVDSLHDQARADGPGFLGLSTRDIARYSLLSGAAAKHAAILRHAGQMGGPSPDGLEAECHRELARTLGEPEHRGRMYVPRDVLASSRESRDMTVAIGSAGGLAVSTVVSSFDDMLRNKSVVLRLGAQRATGNVGNVTHAKQTGASTATWLTNEGTQAAESTQTFVQTSATPKTVGVYQEISHHTFKQVSPAGEQFYRNGLAADLAIAGDVAVLNGSGASGQPLGIIGTAGIGSVVGASIDYAKCVEFQSDVADANAALNPGTLGYVTTPTVAALLKGRQRFTGTDSPLWRGAIVEGDIEGNRAMSSKQMPTASMLYGDWSTLVLVEWGTLQLEVNPFANFPAGILGIRALWTFDVIVTYPTAFSLATSIT